MPDPLKVLAKEKTTRIVMKLCFTEFGGFDFIFSRLMKITENVEFV